MLERKDFSCCRSGCSMFINQWWMQFNIKLKQRQRGTKMKKKDKHESVESLNCLGRLSSRLPGNSVFFFFKGRFQILLYLLKIKNYFWFTIKVRILYGLENWYGMSQLVTCGSMATFPSNNYKIELPKEENTKYFPFWEKNRAQSTWQVVQVHWWSPGNGFPRNVSLL